MIVKIDDDIGASYQEEAEARNIPLPALLAERLAHAGELDPRTRYLVIAGRSLERLEIALGGMPVQSTEELIQRTGRLARIRFGDHLLALTPGQMEEIGYMATKQSKPVARVLEEMWTRFTEEFFVRLPALK